LEIRISSLIAILLLFLNIFILIINIRFLMLDAPEEPMNRTQRLSRALRRFASLLFGLALIGLVFSPGAVFLDDFTVQQANHVLRLLDVDGLRFNPTHLGWMLRSFVWVSMAVSSAAAVLSLGVLIRLLHQFEAGESFSMDSIRLVRLLGWIQVAIVPADILLLWGMTWIVKSLLAQAIHPWFFLIGSAAGGLFFGGVLLLIAFVLEEGCRLKSEQDLVI
jgi:hypothetical protein